MARFKAGEEEHYGGQGGTGFFSIANDKEVKRVRFMYNNVDDIEKVNQIPKSNTIFDDDIVGYFSFDQRSYTSLKVNLEAFKSIGL